MFRTIKNFAIYWINLARSSSKAKSRLSNTCTQSSRAVTLDILAGVKNYGSLSSIFSKLRVIFQYSKPPSTLSGQKQKFIASTVNTYAVSCSNVYFFIDFRCQSSHLSKHTPPFCFTFFTISVIRDGISYVFIVTCSACFEINWALLRTSSHAHSDKFLSTIYQLVKFAW